MSEPNDPDPTVVDQAPVAPASTDAATTDPADSAAPTASDSGSEGPPAGGEPPDGSDTGDGEEPWYKTPAGMVGIAIAVALLGILIGWLAFGGDDDADDASSTSGATSTTTTITQTTAPVPVAPATTSPAAVPANPPAGTSQAMGDLDAAVARWDSNSGRPYVFSYMLNAEGLTGRLCVSGVTNDPTSVQDVTGACGDDVEPGGMGVEAWFASIQAAIEDGTLISASYDPSSGFPTEVTIQPPQVDGAQMTTDFLQFQD